MRRSINLTITGFAVCALMLTMSVGARADNLTLQSPGSQIFQQTQNNPCVIGDPSCNNPAGFNFSVIPNNTSPYDVTSPNYTVQQIRNIVGNTFIVGIDVNTAQGQAIEQLDYFAMLVNGVVVAFIGTAPGDANVFTFNNTNNGNGFSDALLLGFNLAGFQNTDIVTFRAVVNRATDGREEFFLISTTAPSVPEPASLILLGVAISGIGVLRLRLRKNP